MHMRMHLPPRMMLQMMLQRLRHGGPPHGGLFGLRPRLMRHAPRGPFAALHHGPKFMHPMHPMHLRIMLLKKPGLLRKLQNANRHRFAAGEDYADEAEYGDYGEYEDYGDGDAYDDDFEGAYGDYAFDDYFADDEGYGTDYQDAAAYESDYYDDAAYNDGYEYGEEAYDDESDAVSNAAYFVGAEYYYDEDGDEDAVYDDMYE